jgi:cytoskeletal protein CcmA (bactofilin family)
VQEERRVAAWIGGSVVIDGNVTSSEDMTIAGTVNGDVTVPEHAVVIARGARIRGKVNARAVAVQGEVSGAIRADRKVEVGETGVVDGAITSPRMAVAEGAVLNGPVNVAAPT